MNSNTEKSSYNGYMEEKKLSFFEAIPIASLDIVLSGITFLILCQLPFINRALGSENFYTIFLLLMIAGVWFIYTLIFTLLKGRTPGFIMTGVSLRANHDSKIKRFFTLLLFPTLFSRYLFKYDLYRPTKLPIVKKASLVIAYISSIFTITAVGFCLFFLVLIPSSWRDYKQGLPFPDITSTRELLHEASQYAINYSQKEQAISEVYGNNFISSEKGLEAIHLYQDNLQNNLKKSVELTKQAQEKDPHTWSLLTELISKRVDEKQQLYVLDKEFNDNMQKVYDKQMTDAEWNKYSNDTYSAKMGTWNKLNQANTNFNIDNNIEVNPDYRALDYATVQRKYKPSVWSYLSDIWQGTPGETTESYEDTASFPIISRVYDDIGNVIKTSEFNKYVGLDKYKNNTSLKPLKVGDYIFMSAESTDLVVRKMYYLFTSSSPDFNASYGQIRGKETYTETPYFLYKVTPDDIKNTNGILNIEVKIRAEGDTHRVQDKNYDDSAYIEYPLILQATPSN